MSRRLPFTDFDGMILIVETHHGDPLYWDAGSPEKFQLACLEVLKWRIDEGYIVEPDPADNEADKQNADEVRDWEAVKRCLADKDGVAAYWILCGRSGAESEGFDVETLHIPGRPPK